MFCVLHFAALRASGCCAVALFALYIKLRRLNSFGGIGFRSSDWNAATQPFFLRLATINFRSWDCIFGMPKISQRHRSGPSWLELYISERQPSNLQKTLLFSTTDERPFPSEKRPIVMGAIVIQPQQLLEMTDTSDATPRLERIKRIGTGGYGEVYEVRDLIRVCPADICY